MKRILSFILVLSMIFSLGVSMNTMTASAATGDGAMDFEIGSVPALNEVVEGTTPYYVYEEDGYKIKGRRSHYAQEWKIEKDVFGKPGYSVYGGGVTNAEAVEGLTDPCLIASYEFTNPAMLTSMDQYYVLEFDAAFSGGNQIEFIATSDNGQSVVFMGGKGNNRSITSDFFRNTNSLYVAYDNMWHNFKFVVKSADISAKDDGANDATAEDTHQYWIYANGNLVANGTTSLKIRGKTNSLNSFAGFKALQLRYYDTKSDGQALRLDDVRTYVSDSLPVGWEASIDFDSLTETTDMNAINSELWAKETGYFVPGNNNTFIRPTTSARGSIEGGVYGKAANDKAISVSHAGDSTDGTHFVQIVQAGKGYNGMHRMKKGEFFEYQMYMAWEPDAVIIGAQGFYDYEASDQIKDGKGQMLISVTPSSGYVYALGVNVPGAELKSQTWYKFNLVVHSGDVSASNNDDKNWFNLYINDKLVGEKIVFTPTIRNKSNGTGTIPTFLGVDAVWLQNGYGSASDKKSGKVYYDDIMFKNGLTAQSYSPVLINTTDEVAMGYLGTTGHTPGVGSYIDERVSFDAEKWSVTDGKISFVPASNGNTYAKIVKADGTKIYDTFKNENVTVNTKQFAADSNIGSLLNYVAKDFTTYSVGSSVAGRSADDYSFKMESVGVYDNWVMTVDEEGNATSAEYQKDPANWINKSDIPKDTTAKYAFRDSFNPFVQMYKGTHTGALDFTAPWSMNVSIFAGGEFNSKDIQLISNDEGGRVTINLISINGSNGHIIVNKVDTGAMYKKDQWMNFVINVYPATKGLDLWYDGEHLFSGELDFPWERAARIKFQDAIGHDGYHSEKARTSRLYADDIILIQGSRFVPTAVNASSESDKFDSTYLENDVIIANEATTAEDIITGIAGGTVSLYGDKNYEAVTTGAVNKGNVAVIKSADGLMYKYIYVANADQDAKASLAYGQSYQLGKNTFGPKYYTDNVIDGTIIAAAFKTVNGNIMVEDCDYMALENETYEYDGNNLIMTPSKRVEIDATQDTNAVKIFFWDDISGLKPLATEHNCTLKVVEAE